MTQLKDQVVLITGCSSGIGRALAEAFAGEGNRVVATARSLPTVADLKGMAMTVELDVTDGDSIRAAVGEVTTDLGRIDILVNNAGYALMGPVAEIELDGFRRQVETNLMGPLAVTQAVLPQMIERRSGRIVDVGSVSGVTATPFAGAYCASKAALHALDDALRMEVAPFGIQVISVQPGAIRSKLGDTASTGLERYGAPSSAYSPVADCIEARAKVSQEGAIEASDFAREVVQKVLAETPPPRIRAGKHSRMLPLLKHLPIRRLDRMLSRKFGLDRLKS